MDACTLRVRARACISFVPCAMVILYVSPSLSLTPFFSRFPVERRTKRSTKKRRTANEEGGKSRTHFIIYVSTLAGVEGNGRHIHSVRAEEKTSGYNDDAQLSPLTSRRCPRAREQRRARIHIYIIIYTHTNKHSRCSAVSPDEPRGLERSPKNRERMYKHTRRSRTHMHSHRSNIAPLQRDLLQRAVSRHRSLSSVAKTFSVSRHLGSVSRITSYRLELLAFTEPTFAPSTAHNAATIATTTTTTTTTITTTTTLPPILPTTPLLGWARGWRDSCICQDDSSLKGNIGAIAAYAVSSLEFVR